MIRQAAVASLPDLPLQVWLRNRATLSVGFGSTMGAIGGEHRAEAGLTAEEFQIYVRAFAIECDRLKYLLTGRDSGAGRTNLKDVQPMHNRKGPKWQYHLTNGRCPVLLQPLFDLVIFRHHTRRGA